jgi:hypothetical protein
VRGNVGAPVSSPPAAAPLPPPLPSALSLPPFGVVGSSADFDGVEPPCDGDSV